MIRSVLLLSASLLFVACGEESMQIANPASAIIAAQTIEIRPQPLDETYITSGTLIADDRIDIASRMIGYIRQIYVHEGSRVEKGQRLLTIDPTEIQAQLAEAEARLSQSKARLKETKADFERYRTLYGQKMIAVNRYRKAELAFRLAGEEQRAAQATLKRIHTQLQYAEIRAPIAGVVVKRHKHSGDIATPGAPLLTIENPANIVVRSYVKEHHIRHIGIGSKADVTIDAAGLDSEAEITRITPSADPATHSYQVKLVLKNDRNIRAGMFARVRFKMGQRPGIAIPLEALIQRAGMDGVYRIDGDNIAHYRLVRTGRHVDRQIEILSGLLSGDRIVVSSDKPVHTGDKIMHQDQVHPGAS